MTWKFQQIEPQPARGTMREELWDDPNWVAEEKYDGDRRIAQFCGHVVRFTGRRKSVKDGLFVEKTENVPHLSGMTTARDVWENGKPPAHPPPASLDGTVLDGEMIIDFIDVSKVPLKFNEGRSKYVTSIMGSSPEEAIKKQLERGWLNYVVFDCLFYKGKDIRAEPLLKRRALALSAVRAWGNPFVSISESFMEGKKSFLWAVLGSGGEGVVLKHIDHQYGDKTGWAKVKRTATADVVIIGLQAAKKESKKVDGKVSVTKYAKAGLIGAVVCGQYVSGMRTDGPMQEVATVSGMDDALRADITKHPKKYLGKVLRIEHNGREPTGRFRHPRWDGLRTDKSPEQCIFDLEEK